VDGKTETALVYEPLFMILDKFGKELDPKSSSSISNLAPSKSKKITFFK